MIHSPQILTQPIPNGLNVVLFHFATRSVWHLHKHWLAQNHRNVRTPFWNRNDFSRGTSSFRKICERKFLNEPTNHWTSKSISRQQSVEVRRIRWVYLRLDSTRQRKICMRIRTCESLRSNLIAILLCAPVKKPQAFGISVNVFRIARSHPILIKYFVDHKNARIRIVRELLSSFASEKFFRFIATVWLKINFAFDFARSGCKLHPTTVAAAAAFCTWETATPNDNKKWPWDNVTQNKECKLPTRMQCELKLSSFISVNVCMY